MPESTKLMHFAARFRSVADVLSDPRDVEVVKEYVAELEQQARQLSGPSQSAT